MQSISSTEYTYDCRPENEQLPAYTLNPPNYSVTAVYRDSELDVPTADRNPCYHLDSCAEICRHTRTAMRYKSKLTQQSSTREAFKQVFYRQWSPVAGILSLPAIIAYDIVKTPYYLTRITIALSRSKYERSKANIKIANEIINNLSLNLPVVLKMVVRLGIETPESVEREIQDRGYYLYLTLARLLEAYGSRFTPPGIVYLTSQKTLLKEHCSGMAWLHFNQIHELKENLILFDLSPAYNFSNVSVTIERLICTILPLLKNSGVHRNDDYCLANVLLRLRKIQDELKGLLQIKISK